MWYDWLLLIVGMVLLIKGADFFVDGSSRIAKALRIPSLIIGLTLVSMGTSAPELSVSINSAVNNLNDLSIGNVIGSNILNTLLILGLSALFAPLVIDRDMRIYDIPIMVGLYVVLILFSFVISPGILDVFESIGILVLFVGYMVFLVLRAKKNQPKEEDVLNAENEEVTQGEEEPKKKKKDIPIWLSIIYVVGGLAAIIFGGDLVVDCASAIAIKLGMSEALVGLTIVAIGTSLPELVTSVVATAKKELDIAIGNVIGSNIFNVALILGLTSTISNLSVNSAQLFDMLVMLGSALAVLLIAFTSKKIRKWQGLLLFLGYAAYLTYIIIRN
jgi:cation:H+ antiporter